MRWIIGNTRKAARKGDNAALERWTGEGGSVANETKATPRIITTVSRRVRRL